jgi:arginine decarboxylase
VRPELDAYLITDRSVEDIAGLDLGICRRVFYNQEDFLELHLNILRGVQARYKTPFFTALVNYSKQPTGVFHAMPISRGKSISRSHWIQDMGAFYGPNIFLAETSATSGGLDSLLEPHGPIKEAQELASRAFGSRRPSSPPTAPRPATRSWCRRWSGPATSCWSTATATSRTTTAWCWPARRWSIWTAIRSTNTRCTARCRCARSSTSCWQLKAAGKLDRVRMLLLTNCTFDGIVYNVERVMEECLAIKPDLIFLWDEAWFAFARFGPTYRQRTGDERAPTTCASG